MTYNSRETIESKVIPGATFTIKRMSVARRAKFNLAIAEYSAKLREIKKARTLLDGELQTAREAAISALVASGIAREEAETNPALKINFPEEKFQAWADLADQERRLDQDVMTPALVRCGFHSIEGFEIDGKKPDAEVLIEDGPQELCAEIAAAVDRSMGLSLEERLNLKSPTTSAQPVDGPTSNTTAQPASSADSSGR